MDTVANGCSLWNITGSQASDNSHVQTAMNSADRNAIAKVISVIGYLGQRQWKRWGLLPF